MALPGTGPSFTRCGTSWLQLFYVSWSKTDVIIKYFASFGPFGTVWHDFHTHIKKMAVLPRNAMLLITTYYNGVTVEIHQFKFCVWKKNEQRHKSYWGLHFLSLA